VAASSELPQATSKKTAPKNSAVTAEVFLDLFEMLGLMNLSNNVNPSTQVLISLTSTGQE
tara:strand:- start:3725 stop:3904 length:180 start_codon:yes stop_codon:yes gene_type:complete